VFLIDDIFFINDYSFLMLEYKAYKFYRLFQNQGLNIVEVFIEK